MMKYIQAGVKLVLLMNFMRVSEEENNFKNITPDILTSAKTLGGRKASISGYIASERIFKKHTKI